MKKHERTQKTSTHPPTLTQTARSSVLKFHSACAEPQYNSTGSGLLLPVGYCLHLREEGKNAFALLGGEKSC